MPMRQFMSLEGLEATPAPQSILIPESDNTFLELQEVNQGADGYLAMVDETQATAQTLDVMAGHVEATLPEGGLSAPVATALTAAIEQFKSRLSSKRTVVSAVAMEGFASGNRLGATRIALEGIKDFLSSVWAAIVKALKAAIEWIKKVFAAIFGGRKKLAEKAKQNDEFFKEFEKAGKKAMDKSFAESKARMDEWGKKKGDEIKEAFAKATDEAAQRRKAQQEEQAEYNASFDKTIDAIKAATAAKEKVKNAVDEELKKMADLAVLHFINGNSILSEYFRKSPKECYSAPEIAERFHNGRDKLSYFLTHETGAGLVDIKKRLETAKKDLADYSPGKGSLKVAVSVDRRDRVMYVVGLRGWVEVSANDFPKEVHVDPSKYTLFKLELPFDEVLFVAACNDLGTASQSDVLAQKATLVPLPPLNDNHQHLEIASPEMIKKINGHAKEAAYQNVSTCVNDVEKALEAFLQEGARVKEKIAKIEDEELARQDATRLQRVMSVTQANTLSVLGVSKCVESYDLSLIFNTLVYAEHSTLALKRIAEAQAGS